MKAYRVQLDHVSTQIKDMTNEVKKAGDDFGTLNKFIVSHHKGILFLLNLKVSAATDKPSRPGKSSYN